MNSLQILSMKFTDNDLPDMLTVQYTNTEHTVM